MRRGPRQGRRRRIGQIPWPSVMSARTGNVVAADTPGSEQRRGAPDQTLHGSRPEHTTLALRRIPCGSRDRAHPRLPDKQTPLSRHALGAELKGLGRMRALLRFCS